MIHVEIPKIDVEEFKRLEIALWEERRQHVLRIAEIDRALAPRRGERSLSWMIRTFLGENPESSIPDLVQATGNTLGVVASRIQELYSKGQLTRTGTRGKYRYSLAPTAPTGEETP